MQLKEIRKRIDQLDGEVVALLNQRMELALRTRKMKPAVYEAQRELKVIRNVRSRANRILRPEFTEALYRVIMDQSKQIQKQGLPLIGFQGEHGAYGETAAARFDRGLVPVPCREFGGLFDEVSRARLDFGIVPVENSSEGSIGQVNDLLISSGLFIVAEVTVPVHHCLLTLPETDARGLRLVYSHPQALGQCRAFLAANRLCPEPYYDTAGAARMLSLKRPAATGVIANRLCAKLYGLRIARKNIEDHECNATRFVVLARSPADRPGNKCSIAFSIKHEAGSLAAILRRFAAARVNLTRIESRPVKNDPGKYFFLIDFEGNDQDEEVRAILSRIRKSSLLYKFLGCYPSSRNNQGGRE